MFCSARSPALRAVIAIGVACTVDSRFSAVTMISSSPVLLSGVLLGVAARPGVANAAAQSSAAATDIRYRPQASAAHNIFLMTNLPTVKQTRLRDVDCDGKSGGFIPSRLFRATCYPQFVT